MARFADLLGNCRTDANKYRSVAPTPRPCLCSSRQLLTADALLRSPRALAPRSAFVLTVCSHVTQETSVFPSSPLEVHLMVTVAGESGQSRELSPLLRDVGRPATASCPCSPLAQCAYFTAVPEPTLHPASLFSCYLPTGVHTCLCLGVLKLIKKKPNWILVGHQFASVPRFHSQGLRKRSWAAPRAPSEPLLLGSPGTLFTSQFVLPVHTAAPSSLKALLSLASTTQPFRAAAPIPPCSW